MDNKFISFAFTFNRKRKLNAKGEGLIELRAYKHKRTLKSTRIWVIPEHRDNKNKRIKSDHPLASQLNTRLTKMKLAQEQKQVDFIQRTGSCSLEDLKLDITKGNMTFSEFFVQYIEERNLAKGTVKNYKSAYNHLHRFRKKIYFKDLTPAFIDRFNNYLQGLNNQSQPNIHKNNKLIKAVINAAVRRNMIEVSPYVKAARIKKGNHRPRVWLNQDEVERLKLLKFNASELFLEIERDSFVFGCMTGLRSQTNFDLCFNTFIRDDGRYYMKYVSNKTEKGLTLAMKDLVRYDGQEYSEPEKIIRKYEDFAKQRFGRSWVTKPVFGNLCNQVSNRRLKTLARRAGIQKNLTTHVARHSCASYLITKKVPLHIVQMILQHSDLKTTMQYVHMEDKNIEDALKQVKW